MNLSRALSRFLLSSNSNPNKCKWSLLLRSSFSFCTEVQTASPTRRSYKKNPNPNPLNKKFPRPSEIPFQATFTNLVQFVGSIAVPVQLQILPTGVFSVSVLVQETASKDSPHLCIPVIFQGDLAQIAACHLKENDLVYVSGRLCGDASPQTVEDAQSHIQVLANNLFFVQMTCPEREGETVHDLDESASDCSVEIGEHLSNLNLWNDLLAHPENWLDNRSSKHNPACAAFKHKKSSQQLWINGSTPDWVLSKLDTLFRRALSSGEDKLVHGARSLWSDLVDNSQQWWDRRGDKLNGSVSVRYPDFEHKSTGKGLWLDSAPDWVLLKLDSLVFCGSSNSNNKYLFQFFVGRSNTTINEKGGENKRSNGDRSLWSDRVDNSQQWWDRCGDKLVGSVIIFSFLCFFCVCVCVQSQNTF